MSPYPPDCLFHPDVSRPAHFSHDYAALAESTYGIYGHQWTRREINRSLQPNPTQRCIVSRTTTRSTRLTRLALGAQDDFNCCSVGLSCAAQPGMVETKVDAIQSVHCGDSDL